MLTSFGVFYAIVCVVTTVVIFVLYYRHAHFFNLYSIESCRHEMQHLQASLEWLQERRNDAAMQSNKLQAHRYDLVIDGVEVSILRLNRRMQRLAPSDPRQIERIDTP